MRIRAKVVTSWKIYICKFNVKGWGDFFFKQQQGTFSLYGTLKFVINYYPEKRKATEKIELEFGCVHVFFEYFTLFEPNINRKSPWKINTVTHEHWNSSIAHYRGYMNIDAYFFLFSFFTLKLLQTFFFLIFNKHFLSFPFFFNN